MLEMNKVHLMDCMTGMADIPDNYFELAIVDPPYGVAGLSVDENRSPDSKYRRSMTAMVEGAKKWNIKPDVKYFQELFRVSANQIIWGANNFELPPTEYFCIWDKQQTVPNFASAEYAWCTPGWKKPAKVFRYQIHKANAKYDKIHPTQKPVDLYKWLLANYAKEGDKILDTHVGSGSSIIACIDMGFDYMGFEIDADYHKAMTDRIFHFTRQTKLFD